MIWNPDHDLHPSLYISLDCLVQYIPAIQSLCWQASRCETARLLAIAQTSPLDGTGQVILGMKTGNCLILRSESEISGIHGQTTFNDILSEVKTV